MEPNFQTIESILKPVRQVMLLKGQYYFQTIESILKRL